MILCPAHQERTPSCSITRGPDGTPGAHREQPRDQERDGDRLRGVPAQAGDQAEVPGQQQPPGAVPAALPGDAGAEVAERADGRDVDRDQHVGNQQALAERDLQAAGQDLGVGLAPALQGLGGAGVGLSTILVIFLVAWLLGLFH